MIHTGLYSREAWNVLRCCQLVQSGFDIGEAKEFFIKGRDDYRFFEVSDAGTVSSTVLHPSTSFVSLMSRNSDNEIVVGSWLDNVKEKWIAPIAKQFSKKFGKIDKPFLLYFHEFEPQKSKSDSGSVREYGFDFYIMETIKQKANLQLYSRFSEDSIHHSSFSYCYEDLDKDCVVPFTSDIFDKVLVEDSRPEIDQFEISRREILMKEVKELGRMLIEAFKNTSNFSKLQLQYSGNRYVHCLDYLLQKKVSAQEVIWQMIQLQKAFSYSQSTIEILESPEFLEKVKAFQTLRDWSGMTAFNSLL